MKISKIARMSDREITERAAILAEGSSSVIDEIAQMLIAMNRLDERSINDLLLRSVANRGFEETFIEIIFPFLNKVGMMWQTGSADPGTEHFITALLRKRLVSAIDGAQGAHSPSKKKILLFLPEGEWHELVLLFHAWQILKKGHEILYLGQSTPLDSVITAAETWLPDAVITGALTRMPVEDPAGYLETLSARLRGVKIFAGGILASASNDIPGVSYITGFQDENLRLFLEQLMP